MNFFDFNNILIAMRKDAEHILVNIVKWYFPIVQINS